MFLEERYKYKKKYIMMMIIFKIIFEINVYILRN